MKKLVTAACALVAASAFAVESANTVGYTTMAAAQGRFIITSVQLDNVGAETRAINGLLGGVESVAWDSGNLFRTTAAQIQIPNAIGAYDTYYYLADGWFDDGTEEGDYAPGWCDGDGALVDAEITPGVAMWLKSVPGAATVLVAGQVTDDSAITISCPATFALRANAFPIAIEMNGTGMEESGITSVSWDSGNLFRTTAAQVQIPNAIGAYDTYYYLQDGWFDDGTEEGDYAPGWCDGDGALVESVIPVAQGFWTKGVGGSFTLTFAK